LKNIYKKAGGDYIAQVITKDGSEEEYKVDDKNVDAYTAYLSTYDSTDKSADYTQEGKSKLDLYPQQVIEYSVSSSTNKITIKKLLSGVEKTDEYKAASDKVSTVKMSDATVIIDISDVNSKDEYRVVSSLTDGNEYTVVGFDKNNDSVYRYVLVTSGFNNFDSETQLAIFNGSEKIDDGDDDKDAYNVVINGEEQQLILDDDVEGADDFREGDAILIVTNTAGYITKIEPVFANTNTLNGTTYDSFFNKVLNGDKILASTNFNTLLSDSKNDDVDIVFGPVVNKNGSLITIGTVEDGTVNYDQGTELSTSGATIYTYDFASSSKYSRVLLDEGLQVTPDIKAAKTTNDKGEDILDLTDSNLAGDVVFAVARIIDDEVQEIYLIVNND
jgi:hypothetical protein